MRTHRAIVVAAFLTLMSTSISAADDPEARTSQAEERATAAEAMNRFGIAYATGSGVKRDATRAYALISAAVEIGMQASVREAALYELGALSQRLNAKQLERAQADARTLVESRSKGSSVEQVTGAGTAERL